MTYKFLLKTFVTSLGFAILAPIAIAQERPECYIIDDTGQLTNLTDICNVSQKRSSQISSASNESPNTINNNTNVINFNPLDTGLLSDDNLYILGENSLLSESDNLFNSAYYIDNEIGSDYTAYIRRYRTSPNSIARQTLREQIFQFDPYSQSLTSIIRRGHDIPFIIYRYPI